MPPADLNPFRFSAPVPTEDLIDREGEISQLVRLAEGGHNLRLSAPRRFGKTSLLRRALHEAEKLGLRTVEVDLYGVASREDVALRVEAAYRKLRGPLRRGLDQILTRATLRARAGPVEVESVQVRTDRRLIELLDLPADLFERTGVRTVVALDEFQELLHAGDGLDALLRSRIQHHQEAASYIFAGSHPGMMRTLFEERERPLYGQARALELGPLPDEALYDFVDQRFEAVGANAEPALGHLVTAVRGHPQRAMLLAHHLWERTSPKGEADEACWVFALDDALRELEEAFVQTWGRHEADADRRVVAALAGRGRTLFARDTLERFDLTKSMAQRARDRLRAAGDLVNDHEGQPMLTDPLYAIWVAAGRRRPGVDVAPPDVA